MRPFATLPPETDDERFRHLAHTLGRWAVVCLLAVTLTGCVNLGAVHDFATLSSEGATLKTVAAELADSPQRKQRYNTDAAAAKDLELAASLGKTAQKELVAAHGVIQTYMSALATLSGDGIVASNDAVAGLNQQLANAKLFRTAERDAFGSLAELVSKAALNFYRQAKLREMIEQAGPQVPVAIAALQRVVTNLCVVQLEGEIGALNQYYREQSHLVDSTTPRWAVVLVEEIRQDRETAIRDRIQVCLEYGEILGTIAKGHAAMRKNLNHLGAKELVATLTGYQQEIFAVYDGFKKLH